MISKRDHLYLAALLRDHHEFAAESPGKHLLWLSIREGIEALLEEDSYFNRGEWLMLTELDLVDPEQETRNGSR